MRCYAILLLLFVFHDARAVSDSTIIYFNAVFEAEKEIAYVRYYGIPKALHKNRFEVTFYTLTGEKTAMGEYRGRSLKNRSGVFVRYNRAGKIVISSNFRKNIMHGIYQRYYDNGLRADSGSFRHGLSHGTWISWHENGHPKEVRSYKNARNGTALVAFLYGEYKSWFPNGKLKDSGYYYANSRDGVWEEYLEEGKIRSIGQYKLNWKFGEWKYFDERGRLLYVRRFSKMKYDDEGEVIKVYQ